jgi:hypothetical protein
MSAYLPKDSAHNSPYSEGGGLYALGLIFANHGGDIIEYLINQLRTTTTQNDVNENILKENFIFIYFRLFVMVLVLV